MLTSWISRLAAISVVSVCAILACSNAELTIGGPLELALTSNSPVPVTDSLVVNYDVAGRSLLGIAVTWGDESVDSVFFAGSQSARGRVAHLYTSGGSYMVTAEVTDGLEGTVTRELTVTVDP